MRIDIHVDGFELTSQLRVGVQSRLLKALRPFAGRIQFVDVHLQARVDRDQPSSYSCEIVVNLRPSGEVRVRTEDAEIEVSIDRAADKARVAVEHDVAQPPPEWPLATGEGAGGAIEIVLDDNRISQHQRERRDLKTTCDPSGFANIGDLLRSTMKRRRKKWKRLSSNNVLSPRGAPPEVSRGHRRRFMTSPTRVTRTGTSGGRWGRARATKHGLRGRKTNYARHSSRTED